MHPAAHQYFNTLYVTEALHNDVDTIVTSIAAGLPSGIHVYTDRPLGTSTCLQQHCFP